MIDHQKFRFLVKQLYAKVSELEQMFPGRHFTPDGHLVGSLGECLVADAYGLELMTASNAGYDAVTISGVKVEIKATQADTVAFRREPQHVIVVKIAKDGSFEEIFNGPGRLIWSQFAGKKMPTNGQFQISISKLVALNKTVAFDQRIAQRAEY